MNNKGQSLVLFVLLIPVFLLIMYMVYEVGRMSHLRNEINNINYLAMDVALDRLDQDDVIDFTHDMIVKNKDDFDKIDIRVEDDKIYITLEDKLDNLLKITDVFDVELEYVGYIENNKKKIERVK